MKPLIAGALSAGNSTMRHIASHLNSTVFRTPRGKARTGIQVWRSIRRLEQLDLQIAQGRSSISSDQLQIMFSEARAVGCHSLRDVADYLNSAGVLTPKGGIWCAKAVLRMIRYFRTGECSPN